MSDAHPHHGIDYIELPVLDMAKAKAFYAAAFDWRFNDYGPGYCGFVDGARGDTEAGGFLLAETVTPGGPLVVLHSRDLEASLVKVRAAIEQAGGAVTKEPFAFPGGRRFELTDPSGHALGVWSES